MQRTPGRECPRHSPKLSARGAHTDVQPVPTLRTVRRAFTGARRFRQLDETADDHGGIEERGCVVALLELDAAHEQGKSLFSMR